ncbi:MAG: TSUP family transporter [Azospirillum sp.]|nr:TSUP family transporter [Azospirillum sp.]
MQVYLPIAEISVNALLLLAMGGAVGFLSGLFGVGGGFLLTPFLIMIGVPPAVAVGTQANQLVAASISGVLAHWRRGNVDVRMGLVMLVGGSAGSALGVALFNLLQRLGQIDLVISLLYVGLLGFVGLSMLVESVSALLLPHRAATRHKLHQHSWLHGLPFKMRFHRSRLYISALLPGAVGFFGGILVAVMGIGGGFILVPAMIYLVGMPTALVAGTSLFQIIFTTAATTVMQAATNHTVDVMLAFLLLTGGVVGAQLGTRIMERLRGETMRALLALLVVMVAAKLAVDLVSPPLDRFSIELTQIR